GAAGGGGGGGGRAGGRTDGKRKFGERAAIVRRLSPPLHEAMTALVPLIDEDTRAFEQYMAATGLPEDTPEQVAQRQAAIEAGLKRAIEGPLTVLRLGGRCWDAVVEMAGHGTIAPPSDLGGGAQGLETG